MGKTRVTQGEPYWYLEYNEVTGYRIDFNYENFDPLDNYNFEEGNYFHTKEEVEAVAKKLRAVLNGADVIEMPSEEEIENEIERIREERLTCDGRVRTGGWYYGDWFKCGINWLKSKIVK